MRRVRGSSAREPGVVGPRRELVDPSGAVGLGRGEVQKRLAPSLQYRSGSQSSSAELGPGPGALAKRSPESREGRTVVSRPRTRARAHTRTHAPCHTPRPPLLLREPSRRKAGDSGRSSIERPALRPPGGPRSHSTGMPASTIKEN